MDLAGVFRAPYYPTSRRRRRRIWRVLIVVLVVGVLAVAAADTFLYLHRDGQPAAARVSPEPKTVEAARAAAQKAMARAFAGDPEGAYDLLSGHGKTLISKADYVRYAKVCSSAAGFVAQVTDVRLETPDKAVAIVQWLAFAMPINVLYEDGVWTWEPAAELTASWSKPVEKRIAEGKADGSCISTQSTHKAKVGNCLAGDEITDTATKEVDLNIVECTNAEARYKVIGIKDGLSRADVLKTGTTVCDNFIKDGAESVLWQGTDVASGEALCLGPAK